MVEQRRRRNLTAAILVTGIGRLSHSAAASSATVAATRETASTASRAVLTASHRAAWAT